MVKGRMVREGPGGSAGGSHTEAGSPLLPRRVQLLSACLVGASCPSRRGLLLPGSSLRCVLGTFLSLCQERLLCSGLDSRGPSASWLEDHFCRVAFPDCCDQLVLLRLDFYSVALSVHLPSKVKVASCVCACVCVCPLWAESTGGGGKERQAVL